MKAVNSADVRRVLDTMNIPGDGFKYLVLGSSFSTIVYEDRSTESIPQDEAITALYLLGPEDEQGRVLGRRVYPDRIETLYDDDTFMTMEIRGPMW